MLCTTVIHISLDSLGIDFLKLPGSAGYLSDTSTYLSKSVLVQICGTIVVSSLVSGRRTRAKEAQGCVSLRVSWQRNMFWGYMAQYVSTTNQLGTSCFDNPERLCQISWESYIDCKAESIWSDVALRTKAGHKASRPDIWWGSLQKHTKLRGKALG